MEYEKEYDLNVELIAKQEIELNNFNTAISEITKENTEVFNRVLQSHIDDPSSTSIQRTVLQNIGILTKSLNVLIKNKNLITSIEDVKSLFSILAKCESYFELYGVEREPVGVALRKSYLQINNYLQKIRDGKKSIELSDPNNPNVIYLQGYRTYLAQNIKRVKEGLNVYRSPFRFGIDTRTERGQIQSLALQDSLKHLRSGLDFSKNRGNLYYAGFGNKSKADLNEEMLSSVAREMLFKNRKRLVNRIRRIEGETVELSEEELLVKDIIKRAKNNRGL